MAVKKHKKKYSRKKNINNGKSKKVNKNINSNNKKNVKSNNRKENIDKKIIVIEEDTGKNINVSIKNTEKKEDLIDSSIEINEDDLVEDIVLEGGISELEKTVVVEPIVLEENIVENKKCNSRWRIIFLGLLIIFLLGLIVMFFPKIKLSGDENIIISYKDSYQEPGYSAKILDEDMSDLVEVVGKVNNGVVGEYQISYYIDKFGIRFKKTRNVSIVDTDAPEINVYSDVINVCPNEDVPNFEYSAFDEYDGDITSKVNKTINENEVILKVSDKSDNISSKTIKIDRVDSISPVIKLKGDSIMYLSYGSKYNEPGYTVSDNCTKNLNDKVVVSGSVGREIGTYILTYEVVDDSGNKKSVTRKVIVGNKIKDNGIVNTGSIYLTFDDGPNEGTTNKILDILKEEGVKATFFVTCGGPDYLIKRMYDEGHTVALHTATHDYSYIYSSIDNYFSDLNKVNSRVKRITGNESRIIRFPGGSSNTVSKSYRKGIMTELSYLVLNEGYRYFDWNVDAMDASSARTSGDVYYNVTSNLSMNRANVVLMHDTKNITALAIRNIIKFGKENDYQFKKIDMDTYMVRHSVNN